MFYVMYKKIFRCLQRYNNRNWIPNFIDKYCRFCATLFYFSCDDGSILPICYLCCRLRSVRFLHLASG